jgi:hypothetical protein
VKTFAEVMAQERATPEEREACAWWLAMQRALRTFEQLRTARVQRGKHLRRTNAKAMFARRFAGD